MKKIVFKSKEYVEGVIDAVIAQYTDIEGEVIEMTYSVEYHADNKYRISIYVPVDEVTTSNDQTGPCVETKYIDDCITLFPSEKLESFMLDLHCAIGELHKVQILENYRN